MLDNSFPNLCKPRSIFETCVRRGTMEVCK